MADRSLTVKETALALGVHANTVRRWSDTGVLHPIRLPRSGVRRFSSHEVGELARRMCSGAWDQSASTGAGELPIAAQWAAWVDRAADVAADVDLDAYNAHILAARDDPGGPAPAPDAVPEPWTDGFRAVSAAELLSLLDGT